MTIASHTSRRVARRCSLGALGCAALALSGCGGGGSATLSHAQLLSKANALCRATNTHIAALSAPSNLQGLAGYASDTRIETDQLQRNLSALKPSKSDQPALAHYLSALEQGNRILGEISTAAAAGERTTVKQLGQRLSATNAGALAVAAGLSACSSAS